MRKIFCDTKLNRMIRIVIFLNLFISEYLMCGRATTKLCETRLGAAQLESDESSNTCKRDCIENVLSYASGMIGNQATCLAAAH